MAINPDIDLDILPGTLRELAELIGIKATLDLVERYGGIDVYVPHQPRHDRKLVRCIGRKAAGKMVAAYAGETLHIAKADAAVRYLRDQEILARLENEAVNTLARDYGLDRRSIFRIQAKAGKLDNPSLPLFE